MLVLSLSLSWFTYHNVLKVHPSYHKWQDFLFIAEQLSIVCVYAIFSLSSHLSVDTSVALVAQMVKHLPAMWETWVWSLGQEDPLEKAMAPHSSILARKIPWTEEHDRVQSTGSQRVGQDWAPSIPLSTRLLSLIIISLPEILNCYPWKIAWRYRWVAVKRSVSQHWISFFTVILHRIPEYKTDQKALIRKPGGSCTISFISTQSLQ